MRRLALFAAILAGLGWLGPSTLPEPRMSAPSGPPGVHAQDAPPVAPAEERLLFAPMLGSELQAEDRQPADLWREPAGSQAGLRVINAGQRTTRVLLVYEDVEGQYMGAVPDDDWPPLRQSRARPSSAERMSPLNDRGSCEGCGYAGALCSAPIAPGQAWIFPSMPDPALAPAPPRAGTVYSLNTRPARDYGAAWERWLVDRDLPRDSSLADLVCGALAEEGGWPAGEAPTMPDPGRSSSDRRADVAGTERTIEAASSAAPRNLLRAAKPLAPDQPDPDDCQRSRDFHRAFLDGAALAWLGGDEAAIAVVRGEPIAAVAAARMPDAFPDQELPASLDRYSALTVEEVHYPVGELEAGAVVTRSYVTPGVYTTTPEGRRSYLFIQNTGPECARIRFEGFRSGSGQLAWDDTVSLPPGAATRFHPTYAGWLTPDPITIRLGSSQPLAVLATNLGYATSASFPALSQRWGLSAWAIPRAFQEPKPLPGGRAAVAFDPDPSGGSWPGSGRGPAGTEGRAAPLAGTDGLTGPARLQAALSRETNVSVFNTSEQHQALVRIDTQAAGQPARSVSVLVDPRVQNVYQLGFGLGSEGGPGWARLTPELDLEGRRQPILPAFESFRMATDVPAASEVWAAPAWPLDRFTEGQAAGAPVRGAAAFALPDLSGPAVGPDSGLRIVPARQAGITRTLGITDALTARVAIQNLLGREARVALDLYGGRCGYLGSLEQAIAPLQTLTLPAGRLPGAAHGANQAILRVLEGQVTALVETAREQPAAIAELPDLSTAYLGTPLREAHRPPALEPALLSVSPERLDLPAPSEVLTRSLRIEDGLGSGRCLSYVAESDAAWLRVEPAAGAFPSPAQLVIDPAAFDEGSEPLVGLVTLRALESQVLDSPRTLRVVIDRGSGTGTPTLYLPALLRGGVIAR